MLVEIQQHCVQHVLPQQRSLFVLPFLNPMCAFKAAICNDAIRNQEQSVFEVAIKSPCYLHIS